MKFRAAYTPVIPSDNNGQGIAFLFYVDDRKEAPIIAIQFLEMLNEGRFSGWALQDLTPIAE